MVARVFQKTIGTKTFGTKKTRPNIATFMEPTAPAAAASSPSSSTHLPSLLDSSSCSFDSTANNATASAANVYHHVSCFSTASAGVPVMPTVPSVFYKAAGGGGSSSSGGPFFPSMRSLQDNLQLPPFFFSTLAPPVSAVGNAAVGTTPMVGDAAVENGGWLGLLHDRKAGGSELDFMWGF